MARTTKEHRKRGAAAHIAGPLLRLTVPIRSLRADPTNVRLHNDRNLAAIKASLERFGQQVPVVYIREARRKIVKKGNGVLTAARELGWKQIAAIESELAGNEALAFAIADNRTTDLSEFDESLLLAQLDSLRGEEMDLAAMGFTPEELEELTGPAKGQTKDQEGRRDELARLERRFLEHPPAYTWVLIGLPTGEFHRIQEPLERIHAVESAKVKVTVSDAKD